MDAARAASARRVAERQGDQRAHEFDANGAYWKEHIKSNRTAIVEFGRLCSADCATALGAAGGHELPLAELAERFDVLNLVDIDGKNLGEALRKIPAHLQRKVRLHIADVTGGAASRFLVDGLATIEASATAADALEALLPLVARLDEEVRLEAPPGWRASYVISSGLSTQIIAFPRLQLQQALSMKFGDVDDEILALAAAMKATNERTLAAHGRLLSRLTRPGGVAYWADTVRQTPYVGYLGEDGILGLLLETAQFLKTWNLSRVFSTPLKQEIVAWIAAVVGGPGGPRPSTGGAAARVDALFENFRQDRLPPMDETIVTRAVLQHVGHGRLPLDQELELLRTWIRLAEGADPRVSTAMCDRPLASYAEDLQPEGEPARWLWMNSPERIISGVGRAFVVEAQLLTQRRHGHRVI